MSMFSNEILHIGQVFDCSLFEPKSWLTGDEAEWRDVTMRLNALAATENAIMIVSAQVKKCS